MPTIPATRLPFGDPDALVPGDMPRFPGGVLPEVSTLGTATALPPLGSPAFPDVGAGIWRLLVAGTPTAARSAVIEQQTPAVLNEAKAKLRSLGVQDLTQVGNMVLDRDLQAVPGLMAPQGFRSGGFALRPLPTLAALPITVASVDGWNQWESVLIAEELDLTNKTITIQLGTISHMWIIVRRLTARTGARITFAPLTNPLPGQNGVGGMPSPAEPNFDPHARQAGSGHKASSGGAGNPGGAGFDGPRGNDAPDVTIAAFEIDAMPDVIVPGQQGGRGGAGWRGADGGAGQRGRDSNPIVVDCKWGPGYGGDGGRGGDGGQGGRGGAGGSGGDVNMVTRQSQLDRLVTTRPFVLNNGPGSGGDPGPQGDPGAGGQPGDAGHNKGFPCRDEPDRHGAAGAAGDRRGDLGRGSPGATGFVTYTVITEEQWEALLERPWISQLFPAEGFAGTEVTVRGLHFVKGSKVIFAGVELNATYDHVGQVRFVVPPNAAGGRQLVQVRTPDGDLSQPVPFSVRPVLSAARAIGRPGAIAAGDAISLTGKSFAPGATVTADGKTLAATFVSPTELQVTLPTVIGLDPGGETTFVVQNPDGFRTDPLKVPRLPVLDSGFRANRHGYAFHNFTKGTPDWTDYMATFGTPEIVAEAVLNPLLTGAYFLFYSWYLSNNGHCSALAATSLQAYTQGRSDLFATTPATTHPVPNPPPIPPALMHRINTVQGRLLSRDLIVHYADQSSQGLDRVEASVREIEQDMLDGLGEAGARVLCFIPSGDVWTMFSDPAVRDAWMNSHCVVPTRIVYPNTARSLDGARMYIYDNNAPGQDRWVVELFSAGGKINFRYATPSAETLGPHNGFTLGTAPLQKQLTDDVDLPFSGPDSAVALAAFAVDLLLSPAALTIEDSRGRTIGFKDGNVQVNRALGYVCPWAENCILTKPAGRGGRRRIRGQAAGKYTYVSVHPSGRSVAIKDAKCGARTDDVIELDKSYKTMSITPSEAKKLDVHIAEQLGSDDVRYINVRCDAPAGDAVQLKLGARLEGAQVTTPERATSVRVIARRYEGTRVAEERNTLTKVPAGSRLDLPRAMWADLAHFKPTPTAT